MNKTLALMIRGFESSSGRTPEFTAFCKTFKSEFKKELQPVGATNIVFSIGHFYISGFYTVGTQPWYFCLDDVRWHPGNSILFRKAVDYKDFTGGVNQWAKIESGMGMKMHAKL